MWTAVDSEETGGLFSKNSRPNQYLRISAVRSRSCGSDLKDPRSNLGRWLLIRRLRGFARGSGSGRSPELCSAAGGSPVLANTVPQGSIRPGSGSRMDYVPCVVHLGSLRASGWSAAARAATVAALCSRVRRCARVRAVLALALGANRSACMREALAREKNRASVGLCGACHSEFAGWQRRCTDVPVLWFLECATGPNI